MTALTAQPTDEHAHQKRRVEAVGLGPAMLARDRDAAGMNYMGVDPACPQPTRQPEPVATSLERDRHAVDHGSSLYGFFPPSLQEAQQPCFVRCHFLQRLALETGDHPGDQPAREAELDHRDQCGGLIVWGKASGKIAGLRHGTPCRSYILEQGCHHLASRPIASNETLQIVA